MELLGVALAILLMILPSYQSNSIAVLEDILSPPIDQLNIQKRESVTNNLNNIIQQKLIQHGQVLDQILVKYNTNEELLKKMMDQFMLRMNQSRKLDRVDVFLPNQPSSSSTTGSTTASTTGTTKKDSPIVSIVRFGMNINRYGRLFARVILNEIKNQLEPILEVISSTEKTRRSSLEHFAPESEKSNINKWCSIANLCNPANSNPICGYDKKYGLTSKFDSICHMLQSNCYWGYDFTLVSSCEPIK